MMRIAVASDNGMVSRHFGHCEAFISFLMWRISKSSRELLPIRGTGWVFASRPLPERHGCKCGYLRRGSGAGAIDIFNEKGIEVIAGASGQAEAAVARGVSTGLS